MSHSPALRRSMAPLCLGLAGLLTALAWPVLAQQPSSAQANALRQACRADYQAQCASVPPCGSASLACLQQHAASLSSACRQVLLADTV